MQQIFKILLILFNRLALKFPRAQNLLHSSTRGLKQPKFRMDDAINKLIYYTLENGAVTRYACPQQAQRAVRY